MDLRHLRYLLAVVDHGGFRNAARVLHVSQPPITRAIRELEQEVGAALLHRRGAGIETTEAGALLVAHARRVVAALARAEQEVRELVALTGPVRVGHVLPAYFDDPALARVISRLRARGKIALEITAMLPATAARALAAGSIDVAFVFLPFEFAGVDARVEPILHDRVVAAVPSSHPLARAQRVSLAMVARETLMMFPRKAMPERFDDIMGHFARARLRPRVVTGPPSLRAALDRVAKGDGVAIVPERVSRATVDAGVMLRPIADLAASWTLAAIACDRSRRATAGLVAALQRAGHGDAPPVRARVSAR